MKATHTPAREHAPDIYTCPWHGSQLSYGRGRKPNNCRDCHEIEADFGHGHPRYPMDELLTHVKAMGIKGFAGTR